MKAFVAVVVFLVAGASASTRVINGQEAKLGQYPWQVSLQRPRSLPPHDPYHYCGGSLISSTHVMTAAHCVQLNASDVNVVMGVIDCYDYDNAVMSGVQELIPHEAYNPNTLDYDYAIIVLSNEVDYENSDYIQPIPIIQSSDPSINLAIDEIMITSGWGVTEEKYNGTVIGSQLLWTQMKGISKTQCRLTYGLFITDRMICAVGDVGITNENDYSGVCSGDSGGPLVANTNNKYVLVGATSWAEVNCETSVPQGWARLSQVTDWIDKNSGGTATFELVYNLEP